MREFPLSYRNKQVLKLKFQINTFWCGRRDSNSHGKPHTPLKRACLPISARPQYLCDNK